MISDFDDNQCCFAIEIFEFRFIDWIIGPEFGTNNVIVIAMLFAFSVHILYQF